MTSTTPPTTPPTPVPYPFNKGPGLAMHEAYARARESDGMIRVQMPYGEPAWLATRYADVRAVLGDHRFSRAAAQEHDEPRHTPGAGVESDSILSMDPPDHTRLRTLVSRAFTKQRVEELRPWVSRLTGDLLAGLRARGDTADLVEDFALPLPIAVICELLGVPAADRPRFREWSDGVLSTSRLTQEEQYANMLALRDYITGHVAARRLAPKDDLISALIAARDADDRLGEQELVNLCVGILIAGHETTASQIPNFVHVLLHHPEEWRRLREHPELIPAAVEELTRFVPLIVGGAFARYATEDVEVGGVLVREGEPVIVATNAANCDPARFEDPEELRLDRTANQHVTFGHGVHHCLGAPLARLELQEALRALTATMPGLHVAGEVVWKEGMLVRAPSRMTVGW
ncbi:cytochrome P450 [Streptomyces sp. NRRL F-5126]|uniref:cytochrome P450 n=1 Tax=Streptomyces sp. NRRL F-5126 TaxID=1463857 RepID=UPI0004CADA3C|nr:cytochrome P450 [Streptomyces sp. NRRL F-5126]